VCGVEKRMMDKNVVPGALIPKNLSPVKLTFGMETFAAPLEYQF
jgi:hypothetical protein